MRLVTGENPPGPKLHWVFLDWFEISTLALPCLKLWFVSAVLSTCAKPIDGGRFHPVFQGTTRKIPAPRTVADREPAPQSRSFFQAPPSRGIGNRQLATRSAGTVLTNAIA